MFDHIGVVVSDRDRSWALYERLLEPLGIKAMEKYPRPNGEGWMVMSTGAPQSPFFVVAAGRPSFWTNTSKAAQSPIHLCSLRLRRRRSTGFTPWGWSWARKTTELRASGGSPSTMLS